MDRQITFLRMAAVLTDVLMLLVCVLGVGYLLSFLFTGMLEEHMWVVYLFWRIILGATIILFLLRDWLGSPGKNYFGLKLVGRNGARVSMKQSVLRNLVLILPIINLYEAYRLIFRSKRRLGDMIAGTWFLEE